MGYPKRFCRVLMLLVLGLAGMLTLSTPLKAQKDSGMPPDLQAFIDEALKANPEVKQRSQLKAAAQEAIRPAGALDDPKLYVNIVNLPVDTWSFAQEPMTQKQFGVSQKIPFPGKLRLRSEVAEEQAKSEDFVYKDKRNEIRAMVIQKYWGLALTYSGYDITQRNKQFWEQVVQVAETRYGVGLGRQAEVLQAQVELGNYLNRLLQWRQRQESVQADLNALRSKPPQTPVSKPQPLRSSPFNLNLEQLLAQARSRPQLQAIKTLVAKQEKAVDLARKDYFPDVTIGVTYGFRETLDPPVNRPQADFFTTTFMFDLPIWHASKIKPKIREQVNRKGAAREAYQAAWDKEAAAIKDRYARLERLSHQITLYEKGIIPQARQAASTSLADYSVGRLDFARLYQNQIAAFNAELALQEYLKEYEENWAALEWLVGQELPRRPGGKK
ncbi:MAG: TolC family protein [Syntrophales bacterium]|nr:TolC family protein [Syntrophales bacterium]